MPAESIHTELSTIASSHAKQLNELTRFSGKWNSESGLFFSTLLTNAERMTASETASVLYALGKNSTDCGFNFSVAAHLLAGVVPVIHHVVRPEIREAINHGAICANAMTESGSGSDSFRMKTTATKAGSVYTLNGSKTFVTNGPVADYFTVYAMTDPAKGFFGGVSCFLLDKAVHRFSIGSPIEKSSLRSSPMCEVYFDNCPVSEENRIGKEGAGAMIFMESMDWERACIAAMHAGTMARVCEQAGAYVKNRIRTDKPLSAFQSVQFRLADMAVAAEISWLMAQRAAGLVDEKRGTLAAAQAKIMASESLMQVATLAATVYGGNGIVAEYGLTDLIADAQAAMIYSGPNDVLRELIASRL